MKKYFVTIWEESNKIAWVYKIAASKEDAELAAEFAFIARYPNIKFTHAVAEETAEETTETETEEETAEEITETATEQEEEKENESMTTTYNITYNAQYDSHEVTFESKPATSVLDALKALKMRWNPKKACWYGFAKEHEIINAILENGEGETITGEKTEGATVYTDGYLGGGAVYGSKSNLHLYGADLSKAIREDIKRAGIKGVTVRCKSYSGGQSIGVTVTLRPDEFVSLAEYVGKYEITPENTWIYTGNGEPIFVDYYFGQLSAQEQEETRVAAAEYAYERMTTRENRVNEFYIDEETHFTPETLTKIKTIQAIICAYRYDESNSQVDYFHTNFYYDIYTKPAAVKPTTPDDEPTKPAKDEPKEEPAAEETAPVQPENGIKMALEYLEPMPAETVPESAGDTPEEVPETAGFHPIINNLPKKSKWDVWNVHPDEYLSSCVVPLVRCDENYHVLDTVYLKVGTPEEVKTLMSAAAVGNRRRWPKYSKQYRRETVQRAADIIEKYYI